jgi:hypothetical protein
MAGLRSRKPACARRQDSPGSGIAIPIGVMRVVLVVVLIVVVG